MSAAAPRHPALIAASVTLASLLYSIDWTIAAVALPHMQGTFSATHDQISWVITSYIVASAIMIPCSGWLTTRFGRKRVFVSAITVFVASFTLCGMADSLTMEVLARIAQGMGGGLLIPLSHAIVLDTYPPAQHGKALALWGVGAVFGSFIGPTIGGYLTDYFSWRFIFYINLPFGLLALAGTLAFVPETERHPKRRLDWFGFLALATGIGALQMMLDRGGRLDWFESGEIILEACLAVLGFYLFNVHGLTRRDPFLDPHLLLKRSFFVGLVFVFLYGLITLPPLVLMPTFLQDLRGYSIDTIGLLQSPRGAGMLVSMFLGGRLVGRIQPRILIAFGLLCLGVSSAEMASWTLEVGVWPIVWTGVLQGIGSGLLIIPIQLIAFPDIAPAQRTEASGVFNLVRSLGSSIGVSVALGLFVQTSAISHSQLTQYVTPYQRAIQALPEQSGWSVATRSGLAKMEHEIERQAAMMGYVANFALLATGAFAGLPLLLLLRRRASATPSSEEELAQTSLLVE
jgi:MFS transporter, DHA2 family, multidrug resistance protein